ncbi:HIT-like protein [Hyaloraphidium curvatum]|nr:HIT-like protein [Hyaloraphidium curvatum]
MNAGPLSLLPLASSPKLLFSTFDVTRQAFYRTKLTFAITNLKPIVPGHVLVCPIKVVPRLKDLSAEEATDLFLSAQQIGRVIEKAYGAEALTVSIQDGVAAGQTVSHVHCHILPRRIGDFEPNDRVYDELDKHELYEALGEHFKETTHRSSIKMDAEESRKPRSAEEMEREARWLATLFYPDANP